MCHFSILVVILFLSLSRDANCSRGAAICGPVDLFMPQCDLLHQAKNYFVQR